MARKFRSTIVANGPRFRDPDGRQGILRAVADDPIPAWTRSENA